MKQSCTFKGIVCGKKNSIDDLAQLTCPTSDIFAALQSFSPDLHHKSLSGIRLRTKKKYWPTDRWGRKNADRLLFLKASDLEHLTRMSLFP